MKSYLKCHDEQGSIWFIESESGNTYTCAVNEKGQVFCSCPDWLFRHSNNNSKCKHLMEVLEDGCRNI